MHSGNGGHGKEKSGRPVRSLLKVRDFRLLWIGECISLIGDQFFLIALPWLVLQLTSSAFVLGMILAIAGIPRAVFMLVGGALIDRFSPRTLMILSNFIRFLLVALTSALILTGQLEIWMLYIFAFIFGLADAFFYPAQFAILPQLAKKEQRQAANSFIQGTTQMTMFVGPVIAGTMIAFLSKDSSDMIGIGYAFAIDAATFLASIIALLMMSIRKPRAEKGENMLSAIRQGIAHLWSDVPLRTVFFIIAAAHFLVIGPVIIGIPVLANTRFPEGVAAFGIIMSTYGGGSILGIVMAGVLPKPRPQYFGSILAGTLGVSGIGLIMLAFVPITLTAALTTCMMGVADGYMVILGITWIQNRTPEKMMGRMMSLLMLASVGTAPMSFALSGVLIEWNEVALFAGAGIILLLITIRASLMPSVRAMGFEVETESPEP